MRKEMFWATIRFEPTTSRFPTAVTTETCVIQASNDFAICACINLSVMGKSGKFEKNADY